MRLLVVEDSSKMASLLRRGLTEEGYAVDVVANGVDAVWSATEESFDAIVLDVVLPDIDGFEVCRRLRHAGRWAPIVMLTARDDVSDRVRGLDAGADDYLTKPFGVGELLARLRVALRHAQRVGSGRDDPTFAVGDLRIDLAARHVFVRETEVHLTPIEYKLLTTMARHAGKVLTHRALLKEVWGPHDVHETHYLRVFMAGLRRKIEEDASQPRYLLTEPGVGYRLASE